MHKIDTRYAVDTPPDPKPPAVPGGWFSEGYTAAGQRATEVSADWLNGVQGSLLGVLDQAGVTPEKGAFLKLAEAINIISANAVWKVSCELVSHDENFDPNDEWPWMTWVLAPEETVPGQRRPDDLMGTVSGSKEATLVVDNLPPHDHGIDVYDPDEGEHSAVGGARAEDGTTVIKTKQVGSSAPFSIMQPTQWVNRWIRVS